MSNISDEIIANKTFKPCRLMNRDGTLNLMHKQLVWGNPLKTESAIVMKWKSIVLLVIMTFFGLWLLFALAYWLMEMINSRHCHYCNWLDLQECYKMEKCVVGGPQFQYGTLVQHGDDDNHWVWK